MESCYLEKIHEGHEEFKSATREILTMMRSTSDDHGSSNNMSKIMEQIKKTRILIGDVQSELKCMSKMKRALTNKDSEETASKFKAMELDMTRKLAFTCEISNNNGSNLRNW